MPGGGGYGEAFDRESEEVLQELILGKVSIKGAKRDYGVVFVDHAGQLTVDQFETVALRG